MKALSTRSVRLRPELSSSENFLSLHQCAVNFARYLQRGHMLSFDAFFDASGTQNDDRMLTVVGVLMKFDDHIGLDPEWKKVAREFGITRLHMKHFAHYLKEFEGWDDTRRRALIIRLLDTARPRVAQIIVQGLALADYRVVDRTYRLTESMGGAYSLCQIMAMQRSIGWISRNYGGGVMMHMMVEHGDAGQPAMMGFLERHKQYTPILLGKRDTESGGWAGLQLADLVAYEHRTLYEAAVAGRPLPKDRWRKSLHAVRNTLPVTDGLTMAEHITNWCENLRIPFRG